MYTLHRLGLGMPELLLTLVAALVLFARRSFPS
jgi:Sec-independent protein translocase protein TatA